MRAERPWREWQRVSGPVCRAQQDPARHQGLGHRRQELARCLIHPVQVFEHDDHRLGLSGGVQETSDGLEDPRAQQLRIELSESSVARIDRQQRSKEAHGRPEGLTERRGGAVDPFANHLIGVTWLNRECVLEQIDQRMKGERAAERDACPVEPGRASSGSLAECRGGGASCRCPRRRPGARPDPARLRPASADPRAARAHGRGTRRALRSGLHRRAPRPATPADAGSRGDRLDVESAFEERPGLVRCEDGLAGRSCQQPVEQPFRGAPPVGIELDPIVHAPDEHLIGVEREPHRQLCV